MEKKILIKDAVDLIKKAMDKKLYILRWCGGVKIINNDGSSIEIYPLYKCNLGETNTFKVDTKSGRFNIENVTSKEYYLFNSLMEDVNEYIKDRGIEDFNNFFKVEKEVKLTDINELDDEEED